MRGSWWMIVFCAAFTLGCSGKEAERSDSNGADTKAMTGDAPTDIGRNKEGQQAAKTDPRTPTTRPDGMPSDVPMYPYGQITVAPGEGQAKMMVVETDDAFEDVRSYYVREFEKNGWKILHDAPQAIAVEKDDRQASVSIQKVVSTTRIVMNFMGQ